MLRTRRQIEAGMIYHVLNRGNGRRMLFAKAQDFLAFAKLLGEALQRFPVDLLAYCLMGNHWHLLLRPRTDQALSRMMAWITVTHARRHHRHYPSPGTGHLYQGRFKSFPVQDDEHFLTVARYVHANPLRAKLVRRAQDWPWSDAAGAKALPLADWPVDRPRRWLSLVNAPLPQDQTAALKTSLRRGTPFGSPPWIKQTATKLNLASTLRPRGRPRQPAESLSPRYRKRRERREAHKSTWPLFVRPFLCVLMITRCGRAFVEGRSQKDWCMPVYHRGAYHSLHDPINPIHASDVRMMDDRAGASADQFRQRLGPCAVRREWRRRADREADVRAMKKCSSAQ